MFKKIALVACILTIAGCSDSGGGTSVGVVDPGTGGENPGEAGTSAGVWFGNTNFGEAVVVIDGTGQLTGLSRSGNRYEAVHGNIAGAMERFIHRDSENPASATSFTLVGDNPSTLEPPTSDNITYDLTVTNDGQQLDNASVAGAFSLTLANTNDVTAISTAAIAGTWTGQTSFCPLDCDILLTITFDQAGAMTGSSNFNNTGDIAIVGTASAVTGAGANQYLNVSMTWNGLARSGVIHRDRGTERLVLNTAGPDEDTNKSFSGFLTRQ